jgi:hypothetical protein
MLNLASEDAYKVMRCCFLLGQGSSVSEVRTLLMHKYDLAPDQATAAIDAALCDGDIEHCDEGLQIGFFDASWCQMIRP